MSADKKILFVRSGGGMPGLDIHAGIGLALFKHGIKSTHNIGCSAGAVISALDSRGLHPLGIAAIINNLRDEEVRRERFAWKARALWLDYFLEHEPVVSILERLLPYHFNMLAKPLQVVATRCSDAKKITFDVESMIPLREAVLASMSIHGVFPTVTFDEQEYCDGGVRANLPLPDDWMDYEEVWLLIATPPTEYKKRSSIISRLLLNVSWLMRDQIEDVLDQTRGDPKVHVVWPDVGHTSGMLRFNHDLIPLAEQLADQQIRAQLSHREVAPCTR